MTYGELMETINQILEDVRLKESFMGARESLILRSMRESKLEGEIQGQARAKLEVARNLQNRGFELHEVAEILEWTVEETAKRLKKPS